MSETVTFPDAENSRLANLCGVLDENLRQIETALNVSIARRGEVFQVEGDKAGEAARLLKDFYQRARKPLDIDDVQLALVEVAHKPQIAQDEDNIPVLMTRRAGLHGRTARQNAYIRQIQEYDITFGIGPAGTGKTYLAVAGAVDALERDMVKRIVLVRPAVEAGEHLGFLPGDLVQKVDPYLRPLYDALWDLMGFDKANRAFERQMIEVAPLAFMRGRTLNHAFIILDEAQNTTPEQMKMFLTRIGFGSRAVVTGDVTQIDLARHQKSGLIEARQVLKDVRGIAFTEFQNDDVVRHPLVARIIDAYDGYKKPVLELAIQFAVKAELPGRADFRRWAKAALRSDVSAALRIVDADEGLALNRDYRGKDYATNVLTFEYGPDPETGALSGDIVLCAPVVEKEAKEQGKDLTAHYAHLTVHGLLHLQGYDHETGEADALAMEAVESFIMQALGFPDPYQ